jgi:3-methylcrotonyl-CoA carboxylase alpha subunit
MGGLMFTRLLVANRGEIAVRVIRTARRLGIHTIAVYSDADAGALHVRLADEAWRLGPPAPRQSYLDANRLIDVARRAGADAIHPGYGFLSERADFAAACRAAGIAFVGPPAAAIEAMGSKSAAKEAMHRAGVPVLPGYHGTDQSFERLTAEALKVGFPLIIKPSGGGGGKGMQIVSVAAELATALASAKRLAESAFGDPTLLLERYLPAPRHIEVQLIADAAGSVRCLATRDCSVQRRHQKLIEEAPAPDIAPDIRARLHDAGCAVARAVGYQNVGTVEFLYSDGEFWFMEMNTRLQVEHTVTEEVLGLDLVEWQLRIAAGELLPPRAAAPVPAGHAIEVRVCAENAAAGFVPSAGHLTYVVWPTAIPGIRVDAGFETGDTVSPTYDSLLGKVVARGATRDEAIATLRRGLAALRIVGVETNAAWLAGALADPAFAAATPTTRFVADHGEALARPVTATSDELALAALSTVIAAPLEGAGHSPWAARDAFRIGLPNRQVVTLRSGGDEHVVAIVRHAGQWRVTVGDETFAIDAVLTQGRLLATIDGCRRAHDVHVTGTHLVLWRGASRVDFELLDPRRADVTANAHEGELVARLPGTVVSVAVAVGDLVEPGTTLMVVEAMKMEHAILAPHGGRVAAIHHATGDRVTEGAILAEIVPVDSLPGAT